MTDLRDLLEQTTEALIVARTQGVTRREPDPFAYDHRVIVYHGDEGHADGAECPKCDYDRAFDALIETNRKALATQPSSEEYVRATAPDDATEAEIAEETQRRSRSRSDG